MSLGGMVSEVTLYSYTDTGNSLGERTPHYATGSTGVACHFINLSPEEREALKAVAGGNAKVASHLVIFEPGVTVSPKYRMKFGSDYYEVIGVANPDQMAHHLEVQVARVQGLTA
jgi:hypothetical protein